MWRDRARVIVVVLTVLLLTTPAADWCGGLLTGLLAATQSVAGNPQIGQIKTVSGTASVVRDGKLLPAKLGDPVYQSDMIETGPEGGIGITFVDNSVFSTGPGSQLALQEFRFDTSNARGKMLADLRKGTLTAVSGDITRITPGALSIKTPTAILGVRGTTLAVEVAVVGLCQCVDDHSAPHIRCPPSAQACQAACATTQYSFVPAGPGELATCAPQDQYPQERYVVLPNADGRPGAGAISISRGTTTTTLDQPYAAAELRGGETASLAMDPAEAEVIFKQALAARPALPQHFRLNFELDSAELTPDSVIAYRAAIDEIKGS